MQPISTQPQAPTHDLDHLVGTLSQNPEAYSSFRERYASASDDERARMLLDFGTSESDLAMMTSPAEANQIVWTTTVTTTTVTLNEG